MFQLSLSGARRKNTYTAVVWYFIYCDVHVNHSKYVNKHNLKLDNFPLVLIFWSKVIRCAVRSSQNAIKSLATVVAVTVSRLWKPSCCHDTLTLFAGYHWSELSKISPTLWHNFVSRSVPSSRLHSLLLMSFRIKKFPTKHKQTIKCCIGYREKWNWLMSTWLTVF